jgi:hypothetical protein
VCAEEGRPARQLKRLPAAGGEKEDPVDVVTSSMRHIGEEEDGDVSADGASEEWSHRVGNGYI